MRDFAPPVERLIEQFERLPGVGHKSAQRLAFFILGLPKEQAELFAATILDAANSVMHCRICQNLTDGETCEICRSAARDASIICVVADPKDVAALEKTKEFKGRYHVLHGVISPLDMIGPDDIRIKELLFRINEGGISEVILATDPDTTGEATAMYLSRLIKPLGVRVTRLAYGIPVGGHLEFADEMTLLRALEGRKDF